LRHLICDIGTNIPCHLIIIAVDYDVDCTIATVDRALFGEAGALNRRTQFGRIGRCTRLSWRGFLLRIGIAASGDRQGQSEYHKQ
jgi:hypothetical protein